jgi:hypothetical protein
MKNFLVASIITVVTVLIVTSCASTRVVSRETLYDEEKIYPATNPADIKIFQKKPEDIEFIEIGEIIVENARDWNEAEEILKSKAAEYGGDAVYSYRYTEYDRRSAQPRVQFHIGYGFYHRHYSHSDYRYRYNPGYRHSRYPGSIHPYGNSVHGGVGYRTGYSNSTYIYITVVGIVIKFV